MKKKSTYLLVTLSIPILLVAVFGLSILIDKIRLSKPSRIKAETGLSLESGVKIIATKVHRFSLVDAGNYEWLIESDHDMTDWIEKNMSPEGGPNMKSGGWQNIKSFGEVGSLAQGDVANLRLDSVWKSFRQMENGRTETAYLFVAEGRRVAQLSTSRP